MFSTDLCTQIKSGNLKDFRKKKKEKKNSLDLEEYYLPSTISCRILSWCDDGKYSPSGSEPM